MHRLYDFLRRHPAPVDGLVALVLLGISLYVILHRSASPYEHATAGCVAAVMLATVVLLRRRLPTHMLALAAAAAAVQIITGAGPMPADLALLVIAYTIASLPDRLPARAALAGCLLLPTIAKLRWPDATLPDGRVATSATSAAVNALLLTIAFCLAWVLGDSLRTRRAYLAELEERAARLERERATQARIAVAAERARIARELHDVVAHSVSAMIVQADGAGYVLDKQPEQTRAALESISATGRQALTEMRLAVGVLRDEETGTTRQDYVPQPGVEQLADLIDRVREAGLPVRFEVEGTPRPLPTGVELTAYRIVQEALTNTRKHGGPHAGATIRLAYAPDALTVLAEDSGDGSPRTPRERHGANGADGGDGGDGADGGGGGGHGLIGIRERVGMVGGVLVAGPRPGGGFRISATLPIGLK